MLVQSLPNRQLKNPPTLLIDMSWGEVNLGNVTGNGWLWFDELTIN